MRSPRAYEKIKPHASHPPPQRQCLECTVVMFAGWRNVLETCSILLLEVVDDANKLPKKTRVGMFQVDTR